MSEGIKDKLTNLLRAAKELAEYASYAEIVGGISVNRPQVRRECDALFDAIRALPEDENYEPHVGDLATRADLDAAAAELTRLRAKDYAADKLAEVYWRLRSYAVHDDDCTFNRHPHYRGCSCGLKDALDKGEETIRAFQPAPADPTEYELKLAQMKEDFPNGI